MRAQFDPTDETVTEECRRINRGTLFQLERKLAFRRRCDRWRCDDCARKKADALKKRLAKIPWTKLLTITMPPGHGWCRLANLRYQAEHLRSLMRALHRHYGNFRYAWVREVGKINHACVCASDLLDCVCGANGARLHLHMLLDIPVWIEPTWLKATAQRCGLGFVDLRAVRNVDANRYLAKYLTKGDSYFPERTRRFQVVGVPREPPSEGWLYTPRAIEIVVLECMGASVCDVLTDFWRGG